MPRVPRLRLQQITGAELEEYLRGTLNGAVESFK
jgi:hypothetical protein